MKALEQIYGKLLSTQTNRVSHIRRNPQTANERTRPITQRNGQSSGTGSRQVVTGFVWHKYLSVSTHAYRFESNQQQQ